MRPVFGADVPCRDCRATGQVRAKQTEAEKRLRDDENARRRAHHEDPLEPLPYWAPCPTCGGTGYTSPEKADKPGQWP